MQGHGPGAIPAQANGLGIWPASTKGLKARSIGRPLGFTVGSSVEESVPDVAFIVLNPVFLEKGAVFVLKAARPMVLLLVVDVVEQGF